MLDFIEINDVDLSAVMLKDEHTGYLFSPETNLCMEQAGALKRELILVIST